MFPIMASDPLVLKVKKVSKAACLGTVTSREKHLITKFVQLTDDGTKERNMRGIVKVYPNSFFTTGVFHLTNLF
jgi:hypothetical protein